MKVIQRPFGPVIKFEKWDKEVNISVEKNYYPSLCIYDGDKNITNRCFANANPDIINPSNEDIIKALQFLEKEL